MPRIICDRCGMEIPDQTSYCPLCGCNVQPGAGDRGKAPARTRIPFSRQNRKTDKAPQSGLSIAALTLAILGCTFFIGIILAVIDLLVKDRTRRHVLSIFALVISGFWIVTASMFVYGVSRFAVAVGQSSSEIPEADSGDALEWKPFEEQVLLDQYGCKITAIDVSYGRWGYELVLLMENTSAGDINVQIENLAVNGYMIYQSFFSEVSAGETVYDVVYLSFEELEICGIEDIAELELNFKIKDESQDITNLSEPVRVKTTIADGYEQVYDDSGDVLYDQGDFKIVYKDIKRIKNEGRTIVYLYIENNTNETMTVVSQNTTVNDFMIKPVFASIIFPGNKAINTMSIYSDDLEENDIRKIKEIETTFSIFNTHVYDTVIETEVIKIDV